MQISRGDFRKHPKNDDCKALAPVVMALFDGEANQAEARRARAHLLVCQTCANRWLDWNRSRDLLRGAPVSTPPLLLWRVLAACRLAESSRPVQARIFGFLRRPARNAARSAAPATLKAQILSSTTQKAQQPAWPAPRPAVSFLKVPYLAAPALAVWLMVLQRDTLIVPSGVSPLKVPAARVTPRLSRPRTGTTPASQPSAQRAGMPLRSNPPGQASTAPGGARALSLPRLIDSPLPAHLTVSRRLELRRMAPIAQVAVSPDSSAESSHAREIVREVATYSRFVSFAAPQSERSDNLEQNTRTPHFRPQNRARGIGLQPVPQFVPAISSQATPRGAQFALLAPNRAPRLRAARWRNSALPVGGNSGNTVAPIRARTGGAREDMGRDGAPVAPQLLRVSLPTSTPPTFSRARLLSDHFEGEDDRVEEMRSVVDDFRATLATDDGASENASAR